MLTATTDIPMVCQAPKKTHFMCTKEISEKDSKIKYLNNAPTTRKTRIWTKEMPKNVLKSKIQILTTTGSMENSSDSQENKFYVHQINIKKYSKIKDLDVSKHNQYTYVM